MIASETMTRSFVAAYSPDQDRDEQGRWVGEPGSREAHAEAKRLHQEAANAHQYAGFVDVKKQGVATKAASELTKQALGQSRHAGLPEGIQEHLDKASDAADKASKYKLTPKDIKAHGSKVQSGYHITAKQAHDQASYKHADVEYSFPIGARFDPGQERDEYGRWVDEGGDNGQVDVNETRISEKLTRDEKRHREYVDSLSASQLSALQKYHDAGHGYLEINEPLWRGEDPSRTALNLSKAISGAPEINPSTVVYRGLTKDGHFTVDSEIKLNGFQSTSLDLRIATQYGATSNDEDRTLLKIHPKRGLFLGTAMKKGSKERELLLNHGERYRVVKVGSWQDPNWSVKYKTYELEQL